ncbi:MAG: hypothetical protein R3F19_07010 [Verrucomicrobiales bacterium]
MSDHANRRAIAHFIKSLFRRFWPGITAFWLISFGASLWMLIDIDSLPSSTALSWLELLAFVWITVRLAIAESRFRVHGDWRSRPVRRWVPPLSQAMLLIGLLLPALLLRAVCMWPSLPLNRDSWVDLMQTVWVPTLGIAGIVALIIAAIGRWRTMRTWMWITLFAFALIAGRLPLGWMKRLMLADVPTKFQSGGYEQNSLAMSASRKLLPADALLLGGWPLPIAEDAEDYVFEFLRLPISTQSSGEVVERDNLRARIRWMQLDGERLQLGVETRFYNSNVVPNPDSLFFVVKYSDGSYRSRKESERQVVPSALPLAPVHTVVHSGSYTSPMCLPENTASWEELLAGAELLVFAPIDADKLSQLSVPDRNALREDRGEASLTLGTRNEINTPKVVALLVLFFKLS